MSLGNPALVMTPVENCWYSKSLGDGMWADGAAEEIKTIFQPRFEAANRPPAMAVFARHEEGRLHCEVIAYFSPAAGDVAQTRGASPCRKPVRTGLALLAGEAHCWPLLFPDDEPPFTPHAKPEQS